MYVFDTNSFRVLESYYSETFPTFWVQFNDFVASGGLVSVEEVYKELQYQLTSTYLLQWVDRNKHIFTPPTRDEMQLVSKIFLIPHFRQLIGSKQLKVGMPVADPWIIARAHVLDGCVVTEEAIKPNAAKLPNVCEHFGISCVNLQSSLVKIGWQF